MQHQSSESAHRYVLIPRMCERCGSPFLAHADNIKRGWGRFCSRSCASSVRNLNRSYASRRYTVETFWAKLDRRQECWFWPGAPHAGGYGRLVFQGKPYPAHRLAYILAYGPLPDDVMVCHLCDVNYAPGDFTYRRCCRPDHLEAGTHQDNMRHCAEVGRIARAERNSHALYPEHTPRGESHGMAKLTDEIVTKIRIEAASGYRQQAAIARRYGISTTNVCDIVNRKIWTHLP